MPSSNRSLLPRECIKGRLIFVLISMTGRRARVEFPICSWTSCWEGDTEFSWGRFNVRLRDLRFHLVWERLVFTAASPLESNEGNYSLALSHEYFDEFSNQNITFHCCLSCLTWLQEMAVSFMFNHESIMNFPKDFCFLRWRISLTFNPSLIKNLCGVLYTLWRLFPLC